MLAGTNVVALLEPIGFATCSMKFQREAAAAIESLNLGDRFGIVHDTFQHALAKDADFLVPHIRMVHISGIIRRLRRSDRRAGRERVLVDESDRTDTLGQMRRLLAAGYRGPFSFECTAPSVREAEDLTSGDRGVDRLSPSRTSNVTECGKHAPADTSCDRINPRRKP